VTPERYAKRKLKGLPRAELLYTADTLPDVKKYTTPQALPSALCHCWLMFVMKGTWPVKQPG